MKKETDYFDVAIVGGGMAGASLALMLSQSLPHLQILLIEALSFSKITTNNLPSYDDRSSALSLGSVQLYRALGIWEKLKFYSERIQQVHVSDRGHPAGTVLDSTQINGVDDELGYVIENRNLGAVLLEEISKKKNIKLRDNSSVIKIFIKESAVELEVSTQINVIKSGLLVIADGTESSLRNQLGITASTTPYEQAAVIANVSTSSFHNHVAYERFTDSGPMALLPLPDFKNEHRCALVWTVHEGEVDSMSEMDDAEFLQQLQNRFGNRLGFFTKVGKRSIYSLSLHKALEQARHRIVLMGNTAHSMHPVAGQGFNLTLRDCRSLTDVLIEATEKNETIGSLTVLNRYLQRQLMDQENTIGASHLITLLFSTKQVAAAFTRNTGLFGLNFMPGFKQWFAKQAMGLGRKGQ